MSRKLSAAEIFETVEIDLWGNEYTLRQLTRSMSEKFSTAQKHISTLDENDTDGVAHALIDLLDIILKPADDGQPASAVLTPMWDEDNLGLDWLNAFAQAVQEEAAARRRPTSAQATNG